MLPNDNIKEANTYEEPVNKEEKKVRLSGSKIEDFATGKIKTIAGGLSDQAKFRNLKIMMYYKTEAIAVVFRKIGEIDEFIKVTDELTKEGYRITHSAELKSPLHLPQLMFYIFQNYRFFK